MKTSAVAMAMLCMATAAPSAMAGGREPGSLLVYPVHHAGNGLFTVVSVTNTNLQPATILSLGGSTNVHFQYVNVQRNPLNPFRPLSCSVFDRVEALTPADTCSFLTACHNVSVGGAQEGYLVVAAENPSLYQTPWSHNHLLGSQLVLGASGFAYSIEATALRSPVPSGGSTDLNGNLQFDFDGIEYEQLPDRLYIDTFIGIAYPQLVLMNLTGSLQDVNTVLFSVWNDYEVPLSATVAFSCWFEQPLTSVSNLFSPAFLAGVPNDVDECDSDCNGVGDWEAGWATLQSIGVRTPAGALLAGDGALLGAITSGPGSVCNPRRALGESVAKQANGSIAH